MADQQAILFDDVEAWTARRLAQLLNARTDLPGQVVVSNEWPSPTATNPAPWYVVVRYDPGTRDGFGREENAGLGITVLGDQDDVAGLQTHRLAQIVAMYLGMLPATIAADPGNPYAAIDVSGPARLDEDSGRPARYITADAVLVGSPTVV